MRIAQWPWLRVKSIATGLVGLLLGGFAWVLYWILRNRSEKTRYRLVSMVAWVIALIWVGGRKRIQANLALIRPDFSESELDQGVKSNIRTLVSNWAELLSDKLPDLEVMRQRIKDAEEAVKQYNDGRQTIVVVPHIGPMHSLMSVIAALGLKIFLPAEATPLLFYKLVARQRGKRGDIQFSRIRKGQVLDKCLEKLSEGRVVLLTMDMLTKSGVPCPVGGGVGYFPVGAVRLALKSGAALIPVYPGWDKSGQAQVLVGEPIELTCSGDLTADTVNNVRRLVAHYEKFLVENCCEWWRLPWSTLEPAEALAETTK